MSDQTEAMLLPLVRGFVASRVIQLALDRGIFDALAGGSRSVVRLSASLHLHQESLNRVLRLLTGLGLTRETGPGAYELAPAGLLLTSSSTSPVGSWVRILLGPISQAFDKIGEVVETGRSRPELEGMTSFEVLHAAGLEEHFANAMSARSSGVSAAIEDVIELSGQDVLVDIGGGNGLVLGELLGRHQSLRGYLLERAATADLARANLAQYRERCVVVTGDMFAYVPPGGTVYLLSAVLHDWADPVAVDLLRGVRAVMKPSARLIIVEMISPASALAHPAIVADVIMMAAFGGKERTLQDWERLLSASRFAITAVHSGPWPRETMLCAPA